MEVIKKRRGRPPKVKVGGDLEINIKQKHSIDSDSDSDNDYNDGADNKGSGGKLDLKKIEKDSASDFVKREKKATEIGGKIYKISKAQIEMMLK
jgi:hypothetical protein